MSVWLVRPNLTTFGIRFPVRFTRAPQTKAGLHYFVDLSWKRSRRCQHQRPTKFLHGRNRASTTLQHSRWSSSNYELCPDVFAPGPNMISHGIAGPIYVLLTFHSSYYLYGFQCLDAQGSSVQLISKRTQSDILDSDRHIADLTWTRARY